MTEQPRVVRLATRRPRKGGKLPPEVKHRGAVGELLACAWLFSKGFEVYRNVSAWGEADIVAYRGGDWVRVDAACAQYSFGAGGKRRIVIPHEKLKKHAGTDVRVLIVESNGNCVWAEELILDQIDI